MSCERSGRWWAHDKCILLLLLSLLTLQRKRNTSFVCLYLLRYPTSTAFSLCSQLALFVFCLVGWFLFSWNTSSLQYAELVVFLTIYRRRSTVQLHWLVAVCSCSFDYSGHKYTCSFDYSGHKYTCSFDYSGHKDTCSFDYSGHKYTCALVAPFTTCCGGSAQSS